MQINFFSRSNSNASCAIKSFGALFLSFQVIGSAQSAPPIPQNLRIQGPSAGSVPPTKFPDASNTGVPVGTSLSAYTGPCTITTANTVINAKDARSCGAILIMANNVTIMNSYMPRIDATNNKGSVTITDSTIEGGNWSDGVVWGYNINAARINVTGGQHSFHCNDNCTVVDSWLHDQYNPAGQGYHNNAFISNGGTNMVVRHNTLHCTTINNSTGGGCTADLSLFGDFAPISNVLVENNLMKANLQSISFCAYGGNEPSKKYPVATYVQFKNNVFERGPNNKCGYYGAITSFQSSATGNVWSGNKWNDGSVLNP